MEDEQPQVDQNISHQNVHTPPANPAHTHTPPANPAQTSAVSTSSNDSEEIVHKEVRRRGSNKNFELARLTANGEKVQVTFNAKGMARSNCTLWSRHIGTTVKENNIIPHCTLNWNQLTPTILNNLWQAVIVS